MAVITQRSGFSLDRAGIGHLKIIDLIDDGTVLCAREILRQRPRGVLVYIDCPGGVAYSADRAIDYLEVAGEGVPIFAAIETAFSAGFELAVLGCHKVFAVSEWDSELGGFGSLFEVDGKVLVSSQTPKKMAATPISELRQVVDFRGLVAWQVVIDFHINELLNRISRARSVPVPVLNEVLDGQVFSGHTARFYGLIDGFATVSEIYDKLVETLEKKEKK